MSTTSKHTIKVHLRTKEDMDADAIRLQRSAYTFTLVNRLRQQARKFGAADATRAVTAQEEQSARTPEAPPSERGAGGVPGDQVADLVEDLQ